MTFKCYFEGKSLLDILYVSKSSHWNCFERQCILPYQIVLSTAFKRIKYLLLAMYTIPTDHESNDCFCNMQRSDLTSRHDLPTNIIENHYSIFLYTFIKNNIILYVLKVYKSYIKKSVLR